MTLKNLFLESPAFRFQNNIFYQRGLSPTDFERIYLSLREKENRFYSDEVAKNLPSLPPTHPLSKEWKARAFSSQRLIAHLSRKGGNPKVLDLGCGNGWLSNMLAAIPGSEVVGVDVNDAELRQAARVFEAENLFFACADVLGPPLPYCDFDYIVLASSVQYFNKLETLLDKLSHLLTTEGEIHIIDSPFYNEQDAVSARKRSEEYFIKTGSPQMGLYYHHHTWESLRHFEPEILYDPGSLLNRMTRRFSVGTPFPWIKIKIREGKNML